MKVKMKDVLFPGFSMALQRLLQQDLPPKIAYEIIKITDAINEEEERFKKLRQNLLDQYGKRDEEGKLILSTDGSEYLLENKEEFEKRFNEILDLEFDVAPIPYESVIEHLATIKPVDLKLLLGTVLAK